MFALLGKSRSLNLPIDIQLQLFDVLIVPILLYGSEAWSYENCEIIEKLHLRYCKYVLGVNSSTYRNMVYGELGRTPLSIEMKTRTVTFWARLISGEQSKLSAIICRLLYNLDASGFYSSPWLLYVKQLLNESGFSHVWINQNTGCSVDLFKKRFKQRIYEQYLQTWSSEIFNSPKCKNYRMYKTELSYERYLNVLPTCSRRILTRFRCRNHKLPIEIGCYYNIERNLRTCSVCNSQDVGDEFHYLFNCTYLRSARRKYLPNYCQNNPSAVKFSSLMNADNENIMQNLVKMIKSINNAVQ